MLTSGVIPAVWKLSRKTLVGAVYPIIVLGGGLLLGVGLGLSVATSLRGQGMGLPVAIAGCLLLFWLVVLGVRYAESQLNTTWLVRIFSFTGKLAQGQVPELEARLDALAERITNRMRDNDVDEILLVGFSVGSILAASCVARVLQALEDDGPEGNYPVLSLMTLGHCIPMLGLLPKASNFRRELCVLAQSNKLVWFDFSSPTDWGSFAMIDPALACKVNLPRDSGPKTQLRSPRFHTMFTPAAYSRIKRNKRRLHLQYLRAGELPAAYDYFMITAGVQTLGARFADR
jgi:hypothetical protein